MRIGFIGIGNMGEPMARNLIRAGYELTVFNRTRARAGRLRPEGVRIAESPADAARAVEKVVAGMADTLGQGAIHMSCSTTGAYSAAVRRGAPSLMTTVFTFTNSRIP